MTLIRTSLLNAIAVVIKMLTLLGINKILAIYVGPIGYASLGQFQNAVQMITTLASGAVNVGVTKYTAQYYEDEEKQRAVWRTAGTIALIGSVVVAVLVIVFSRPLAVFFLKDEDLCGVFVWFAIALVFLVFNFLLLAILNGRKEINRYVIANIAGSLFAFAVTTTMAGLFGLYGALVALATYQSFAFFVTLWLCRKASWFKLSCFFGRVDKKIAKNLLKYTAMALTSAACVPLSHILIRNHIGETLGWQSAGYWEAMWRLSIAYLMLVTTTLSFYYLPKLSELKRPEDIRREIFLGYRVILPTAVACGLIIYFLRNFIIKTLFSVDFMDMQVLFAWQMIGDTLKIAGWILGYVLTARAMVGLYMFSEVLFSISFYALVVLFSEFFGMEGASMAHAVNYSLHLAFMFFALRAKGIFH